MFLTYTSLGLLFARRSQGGYLSITANNIDWRTITLPISYTRTRFAVSVCGGLRNAKTAGYSGSGKLNEVTYFFYLDTAGSGNEPFYYITAGV